LLIKRSLATSFSRQRAETLSKTLERINKITKE
jgi:hypothetical protein